MSAETRVELSGGKGQILDLLGDQIFNLLPEGQILVLPEGPDLGLLLEGDVSHVEGHLGTVLGRPGGGGGGEEKGE